MQKIKKIIDTIDKKIDLRKFIKFGLTGVLNTAIDWGVFTFCNEILHLPPVFSQPISYTVATVNSFFINKNWTFEKRKNYNKAEIFKFITVNLISLIISTLGVYLLHNIAGINEYISKIGVAVVTITINYFGNKLFVFK